jgi:hypothetical protein
MIVCSPNESIKRLIPRKARDLSFSVDAAAIRLAAEPGAIS